MYTHRTLNVNGVRLHVAEAGPEDGKPVILLHGFPETWRGWHQQVPALVEAGRRVIVPDQRGYHRSEKPSAVSDYDIDVLSSDVTALADAYGADHFDLVGHDWGAAVAWNVAAAHPGRLRRLAILNVPHPRVMVQTLTSDLDQLRRSWYIFFFQIPMLPEWMLSRNDFAALRKMLRASGHPDTFTDEHVRHYVKAWSRPGAVRSMIHWYRAAGRRAFRAGPPTGPIRAPTLVIWGAQDVALSMDMAQPSVDLCLDGRLAVIDDATHWVQHDAPTRVSRLLLDHLNG